MLMMNNLSNHIDRFYLMEELDLLNEIDLKQFLNKIGPEEKIKKKISNLQDIEKTKDPEKILSIAKKVVGNIAPNASSSTLDSFMMKKLPDYNSNKKVAKTVIGNTFPSLSEKSKDIVSSFLATSSYVSKNPNDTTKIQLKNNITMFVNKVRGFSKKYTDDEDDEQKKNFYTEIIVGTVIVLLAVGLITAVATGVFQILTAAAGILSFGKIIIFAALLYCIAMVIAAVGMLKGGGMPRLPI
jgi:hypothetical protein